MRGRMLAATVATGVLVPAGTSFAGGWWGSIQVDGNALGVGETVAVSAQVMFDDVSEAEHARAHGGYHAYFIDGFDRSVLDAAMASGDRHGWWQPPAQAVHLGEVTFHGWDANLAVATATIEVPEVPQGHYDLMFCTLDCEEPLADLIPTTDVRIFADGVDAQLARDVAGLTELLHTTSSESGDRIERLRGEVRGLGADVAAAADDTTGIADSLERLTASPAAAPPATSPWWASTAGWFLAGALAAWTVAGRRRGAHPERSVEEAGPEIADPTMAPPEFVTHL